MAYFQQALTHILSLEGGLSKNPYDKGGTTNFGISQRFLTLIKYPKKAEELTIEDAEDIYKNHFWENGLFEEINNQKLADKIFDICVHFDFSKAIQLVQQSCNIFLSYADKIAVDGIFGKATVEAINKINVDALLSAIREKQEQYYKLIVLRDPSQEQFLKGWLNRVTK